MPASFQDGTSNTIALAEKVMRCSDGYSALWGHGSWDLNWMPAFQTYIAQGPGAMFQVVPTKGCNHYLASTMHAGGMQVAMCDGSVRNLSQSLNPNIWWWACTPSGGETLSTGW